MKRHFGGHLLTGRLRRVVVADPESVGWADPGLVGQWQSLGYLHAPDVAIAARQHAALRDELKRAGAEVIVAKPKMALGLDAVYVRDPSIVTRAGAILLNPGKPNRVAEVDWHEQFYRDLDVPILGRVEAPGSAEAGDLAWLDSSTLLAGRSYRTNQAGIEQLAELLFPLGVRVHVVPLPHGDGPDVCLHLMSILSPLDETRLLVDMRWMAVETLEEFAASGLTCIPIVESERESLACNVLALGEGRVLAFAENPLTNARIAAAGFDVRTVEGSEIGANGTGGPTCLTRPILCEEPLPASQES